MTVGTGRRPLHPLGAAGVVAQLLGLVAWLWTGEWRWALTGLVVLLILAVAGATLDGRKDTPR